jgi:hypothetical protein
MPGIVVDQSDSGSGRPRVVPASLLFDRMKEFEGFKRFALTLLFLLFYIASCATTIDWVYARETYSLYNLAEKNIGALPFDKRDLYQEQVDFVNRDFDLLTTNLLKICTNCKVAITDQAKDLKNMALNEFVCSDFDSLDGSNDYPDRDCLKVDMEYARAPSPANAPCCINQTLVTASMSVMTFAKFAPEFLEDEFLSEGALDLKDLEGIDDALLAGPPHFGRPELAASKKAVFARVYERAMLPLINADWAAVINPGSALYVLQSLEEAFMAQVIVSRNQRMVGVECHAKWLDKINSPGYVVPHRKIWSFNFGAEPTYNPSSLVLLPLFTWTFWVLGMLHEFLSIYQEVPKSNQMAVKDRLRNFFSSLCGRSFFSWLLFLITFLPILPALGKASMGVDAYTVWVSVVTLLVAMRVFVEGKVLKPCLLVVRTIEHGTSTCVTWHARITA